MTLMKKLINEENDSFRDGVKYARWTKIYNKTEQSLEQLSSVLSRGSVFSRMSKELGGDQHDLDLALDAFNKLEDALMNLHMTIGITQQPEEF